MFRPLILATALLLSLVPLASQAQRSIPFTSEAWSTDGTQAVEFTEYLGVPSLKVDDGGGAATGSNIITVADLTFSNGTIEYDVALTDRTRFTSIHFRRKDPTNSEHFYLRANTVNMPNTNSAVQYAAVLDGVNIWDLSSEYQSNATLKQEGWNHIKLVVRDAQLLAYVNDMSSPALYVPIMDGDWASGSIGFDGNAYIANLTVDADRTPGLAAGAGFDPVINDARYLREWRVSTPTDLPRGAEPTGVPDSTTEWSAISAERLGMVNLSRSFGATAAGARRIVWLKTTLRAAEAMTRQLDFGFSDEVYVYLNGKPLYVDKNLYNTPGMKAPEGRCSIENSRMSLPLVAGDNDLLIGVTNFFFGWGVVARLDDASGLQY